VIGEVKEVIGKLEECKEEAQPREVVPQSKNQEAQIIPPV
jgi:hypothetical protein